MEKLQIISVIKNKILFYWTVCESLFSNRRAFLSLSKIFFSQN
jgi:hypothetical protein